MMRRALLAGVVAVAAVVTVPAAADTTSRPRRTW